MFDRRRPKTAVRRRHTSQLTNELLKGTSLNLPPSSDNGRPSFQIQFVLEGLD